MGFEDIILKHLHEHKIWAKIYILVTGLSFIFTTFFALTQGFSVVANLINYHPIAHINLVYFNQEQNPARPSPLLYVYNDGNATSDNFSFKIGIGNVPLSNNLIYRAVILDKAFDAQANTSMTGGTEQNQTNGGNYLIATVKNLHQQKYILFKVTRKFDIYQISAKSRCNSSIIATYSNPISRNPNIISVVASYTDAGTCKFPNWISLSNKVPFANYSSKNFTLSLEPGQTVILSYNVSKSNIPQFNDTIKVVVIPVRVNGT